VIVEVIMPKTGMYEDDVSLVEWLVDDGAEVAVGDPLFVMETEKVEVEIEADDPGFLVRAAAPGLTAPIGTRIGWLASTRAEYEELRAQLGPA
jgi:pyruvate dehydrogenase E2 component (dihydrolipoamide acetyltransferase)